MEEITSARNIISIIRRLHKGRALLSVSIPHVPAKFHSTILEIDPEDDHLILDELKPQAGHEQLLKTRTCRVRAWLDGVLIAFSTKLLTAGEDNGIALYHVTLPPTLIYRQRRDNYRVKVRYPRVVPVTMSPECNDGCSAELLDVSFAGLALLVKGEPLPLKRGDIVEGEFSLNESETLSCRLEVRHITHDAKSLTSRLGCRFISPNPQQRKLIQRFVVDLERELIKKHSEH